jgi:hypothetical protein
VSNLRLKRDIADIIIGRLQNLQLPFTAVHLRGTDRLKESEFIASAIQKYNELPEYAKLRTYVFSDMAEMIQAWKEEYQSTKVLFVTRFQFAFILNYYNVEKHSINIDTLTDFIVLCFAKWTVGNNDSSVFTKMGKFISKAGPHGISKWLHGFKPETSFL